MSGSHHPWLVLSFTCAFLAVATSSAQAQSWLSDRKRAEGAGIRLGDFELHPGIGTELGYTSNVYNAEPGERVSSVVLRVAPHLFLSTLGAERSGEDEGYKPGIVAFRGGLQAALFHYFAEGTPSTDVSTDVNLLLTLAPERPISFTVTEVFNRAVRPFSDPVNEPGPGNTALPVNAVKSAPTVDFARYTETIGAKLDARTDGGLLTGGLGYRLSYGWYEDESFVNNNKHVHSLSLTGAWQFLPQSALFYDATYAHQTYTNREQSEGDELRSPLVDNDQVTTRIGFNGAITSRISATIAAGYAVGFFGGNDFEGLTANVEGRWLPSPVSELALGYERGFSSAFEGNFVLRNQIYTRLRYFFGGAFVVGSKLAVEFLSFGPDPRSNQSPRRDTRYSADINGEYRFIDWLAATAQFTALIDTTAYRFESEVEVPDRGTVTLFDPAKFNTFEAWLGLRAFF
jgi:hypothetical protein